MRLKNIILGVSLALLGLSACSNETIIDERNDSTSPVQIILNSVPTISKTGSGNVEYAKPTEKELIINNCVLGIYDETAEAWHSTRFVSSLNKDVSDEEHDAYIVATNLSLINNHKYKVMVIGNVDEKKSAIYESCNNESAFERIIEGSKEYTFDASKLLKYGVVSSFTVSPTSNKISVPLDILAARVEFVINMKQDAIPYKSTYYEDLSDLDILNKHYTAEQIESKFEGAEKFNTLDKLKEFLGKKGSDDLGLHYGDRHITFNNGNGIKGVYIPFSSAIRIDEYEGKALQITSISVKNIRTQAIAVLPIKEDGMFKLDNYSLNLDNNGKYSFYTYALSDPLEVIFSGEVKKTTILKHTPVKASWVAFADNNKLEDRIWGSTGSSDAVVSSGWGSSGYVFFTMTNWEVDDSYEIPDFDKISGNLGAYENQFKIKGQQSNKIEYGHFYDVTATITDFTPQSKGELFVKIQDYINVVVPPFTFE